MTELIWEGKYDKDGNKVAPLRVKLPFQTVETVNESSQERQHTLDLFSTGRPAEWRNRLIWGDKKYVLPALLDELAGQVNLIYIDPPFNTGADFSYRVQVDGEGFVKEPSILEQKAYRDTWGKGIESYIHWFYETAVLLHELLHRSGSIYVHLDWHVGHYVKIIMDEIFGKDNFRNEISCKRIRKNVQEYAETKRLNVALDTILFYSKSDLHRINQPRSELVLEERWHSFDAPELRQGMDYELFGVRPPPGRHWMWEERKAKEAIEQGVLRKNAKTGKPEYKVISENPVITTLWDDIPAYSFQYRFETEKSEKLLSRIIQASSSPGDLILDCFVGSGTTAAVAEQTDRRWIACDLGRFAIHTTRKRLLSISGVKPFIVQNLGKYERQLWQAAEFGEHAEERVISYRHFILELYNARSITGYTWLHGVKAGRMVHIGAVDSPVSPGDVTQIASEFKRAVGTGNDAPATNGVDVLGWDFAFELNEVAKQQAAQANINLRFLRIPREVLEKKAVEQGDIKFFELAALSVDVKQKSRTITLTLTDFVIPPDDVPEDVRQTITNWEQWIDYWAVDWNNRDDTFQRMTKVIKTGDSSGSPSVQYQYNSWGTINQQNIKTITKVDASTFLWQTQYFDGLGRVVQVHANGESGHTIIASSTAFNNRGLADKRYVSQDYASILASYQSPDAIWKYSTSTYDALGRVVTQTGADGTSISHDYSTAWQDTLTNQRGFKTRFYYDAFQRLVKVEELNASHQLYATTTYTYDILGNLLQVVDNNNNTTTMTYDWLSRKTAMLDPDMGAWSYGYDNNGNLVTQTDAKSQTITMAYDALNRLVSKVYPVGSGMTNVSYTYDSTAGGNFGKGQRTSMTDTAGTTSYLYDYRGRMIQENRVIDTVSYITSFTYDGVNRPVTTTYPTGETVTQNYNGQGLPYSLSGSAAGNIVTNTLYNNLGSITEIDLGNGLKTTFGYYGTGGPYDTTGGYYGKLWEIKTLPQADGNAL